LFKIDEDLSSRDYVGHLGYYERKRRFKAEGLETL
jgi:hypothetical protein